MTRVILDPNSTATNGTASRSALLLDRRVRKFGRVPEFNKIEPGDAILFEPVKLGWLANAIQASQRAMGFDPMHARWTHAAVAVDDRLIIEANLSGVAVSDLVARSTTYRICVRRPSHLNAFERQKLALQASNMLRQRYSFMTALDIGWASTAGFVNQSTLRKSGRGVICSKLYSDCYLKVSGNRSLVDNPYIVTPAHLSISPELSDVAIGWLSLE